MENNYKRQYRELDDTTKQKISQSLRGRCKSSTHKENIANGMREYWLGVPSRNNGVKPLNNEGK